MGTVYLPGSLLPQANGGRAEESGRERWSGKEHPTHTHPSTNTLLAPSVPSALRVYAVPEKLESLPRSHSGERRRWAAGGCPELAISPPCPLIPSTPGNSPRRQAQEVQEGETDPGGRRDRGYLLGKKHLCNMPYFKPVHVSRLSRCPGLGARRGQRLSAACAHSAALSQPEPRRARVCTRAWGGGTCLSSPPPFLAELSECMVSCVYRSTPFRARILEIPGLTLVLLHPKAERFLPTSNSLEQDQGLPPSPPRDRNPPPQVGLCP